MTTECNQFVLGFHPLKRREIRAQFDGGAITTDGGGLLLREVEKRVAVLSSEKLPSRRPGSPHLFLAGIHSFGMIAPNPIRQGLCHTEANSIGGCQQSFLTEFRRT